MPRSRLVRTLFGCCMPPKETPAVASTPLDMPTGKYTSVYAKQFAEIFAELNQNRDSDKQLSENDLPEEFFCSLTLEIMTDPVMTIDGYVYERRAIESWFLQCKHSREKIITSPMTALKLDSEKLEPMVELKREIEATLQKYEGQRASDQRRPKR